jgi:uncharacterized protein (DUF2267 family)
MKTGVHVLEQSLRDAQGWLSSVSLRLNAHDNGSLAFASLRATLHALRDQLDRDTVMELGARLPALLRGLYYDGWNPASAPAPAATREDFMERVEHESPRASRIKAARAAKAALEVIFERLPAAVMAPVVERLPANLRELWPDEPPPYIDPRQVQHDPDPEATRRSRASPSRLRHATRRASGETTPNALPERSRPKPQRSRQSRNYL